MLSVIAIISSFYDSLTVQNFCTAAFDQALIQDVKAKLAQAAGTPSNMQRLVFRGRVLKDEQRLNSYSTSF